MNEPECIYKKAYWKTLPIFFSYVFLGFSYGIMMEEAGFAWYVSLIISLVVYTGAFQFVLIGLLGGGTSVWTIAVTALLMNSRQIFYSLTFYDDFKAMGKKMPYMIHTLTDETYAVNCTLEKEDPDRREVMFFAALYSWCYWAMGTVLGGILGTIIPVPLDGIDFCMTALFLTIFMDQWKRSEDHGPAVTGLLSAACCFLVFGKSAFMLPALLLTSALLLRRRKGADKKEGGVKP